MKKLNRVLSIALSLLMIFSVLPFAAVVTQAETDKTDSGLTYGYDNQITRAEWLHDLSVVFDMTVESDAVPDNYFSDLPDAHPYYNDILLTVEFGVIDIEAGGELNPNGLATRDFAASTLNFCLGYQATDDDVFTFSDADECSSPISALIAVERGWLKLVDNKFMPELAITSAEAETMLNDAVSVLKVSEIDANYDNKYDFEDDVIVVPESALATVSDDTVIIEDSPVKISSGDRFAVYENGIPTVYLAKSVETDESLTTITKTDIGEDDAFESIDAQGQVASGSMEFMAADGVELEFEEIEEEPALRKAPGLKSVRSQKKIKKNIKAKTQLTLTPGVTASLDVKINNPVVNYQISSGYSYVTLEGDSEISYSLKGNLADAIDKKSIELFTCSVGGIGNFDITVELGFSGSVSGKVKGYLVAGIECTKGDRIRPIYNFQQKEYYVTAEAEASAGIKAWLGVTKLPVVKAYIYAEIGAKAKAKDVNYVTAPYRCTNFDAYLYFKYGADASVKFGGWKTSVTYNVDVFHDKNSPVRIVHHYEDGLEVSACTHDSSSSNNYYTNTNSRYSGNGWTNAIKSYGINKSGDRTPLYEYTVSGNKATITKYNGDSNLVYIPSSIDGYTITKIGEYAFSQKNISCVYFPESIIEIASYAFYNCSITKLELPKSISSMSITAFHYCSELEEVFIPKNFTIYGSRSSCFYGCGLLSNITFGKDVTHIPEFMFMGCSGIRAVTIPETVTDIGNGSFYNCINLSSVSLSRNIKSIGYAAFSKTKISEIFIPKSLENCKKNYMDGVYVGPFGNCPNLSNVYFEDGIKTIPFALFEGCSNITDITIPNSVTSIGQEAFYGCTGLTSITIPDSVTSIGGSAFYGCTGLTSVTIPDSVTSIGWNAFSGCTGLTSVTIPDSVTSIGGSTFYGCTGLTSITIPDSVTSIRQSAFSNCTSLKYVELSKSLTGLGALAFSNTAIETIEIPKSLKEYLDPYGYVGSYNGEEYQGFCGPFSDCKSLKTVIFENGTTQITEKLFAYCTELETIIIPDTVTSIGEYAFIDCIALNSVVISSNATVIGDYAFRNCKLIKNIDIPESVKSIGDEAFYNCISLNNTRLPNGIVSVGKKAFGNCISFSSAFIPKSLETASSAFYGCNGLKEIIFEPGLTKIAGSLFENSGLEEIIIPNSVTSIGGSAFSGCSFLKSVKLPNSIQKISSAMFQNCTSLKTIELPSTVTTIQSYAFSGCTALESFTFENEESNLQEIQYNAFYGCTSLKEAVFPETVKSIGSNAFQNCTSLEKVYIPQSTKTLGSYAFQGDEALKEVTISDYSITIIYEYTFKDCPALASIVLPKGLTTVGSQAFMNDTSLFDVTIPESVTSINSNALSYPAKTTIHGKAGSYAETFATNGGFKFNDNGIATEGMILEDEVENITLDVGETFRTKFEKFPDDANDVITIKSNNSNVTINGHDIYARYTGDSVLTATASSGVTYEFNVHIRSVSKIAIKTPADKLSYIMGEEFDKTGLVAEVTYNDKSTKEVTDFTISGFDSSAEGECTVTVSWVSMAGSTYKTTFKVNIVDPTPKLTGIFIQKMPTKREYERREAIDLSGMVVMGRYTDGANREISDYSISGYNSLKTGIQTITVTVGEYKATFEVAVGQKLDPEIAGDFNNDNIVTDKDATYLLFHLFFPEEYKVNHTIDFNGDGNEDTKDVIYLLYHIYFPKLYPIA